MDEHENAGEAERSHDGEGENTVRSVGDENLKSSQPHTNDGASPGKIFVGGLARETTTAQFIDYFCKYGEITDSVIMKDRNTGQPRGFGFVTYADPSVVARVIEETHIINGKQVEIKRTLPREGSSKDVKTKKIFVGGIPATVAEDEFREFFSKFGAVMEHQIMRDHASGRSRGFGFIVFESEQTVEDILANGSWLEFAGAQVEIKKAEPRKPYPPQPPQPSRRASNSSASVGGHRDPYGGFRGGGFAGRGLGPGPYGSGGSFVVRASSYGAYGGSEYGAYRGYGAGGYDHYGGADPSLGYSNRFGGGYGRGYDLGDGYSGAGNRYSSYRGGTSGFGGYGGGYDTSYSGGYGSSSGAPLYGNRGGYTYGGALSGRYHPYGQ